MHQPEADAEAVPQVDGADGERQVDDLGLGELRLQVRVDIVRRSE
jgi:hypothetical protein